MVWKMQEENPMGKYLTYDQMNILTAYEKLWIKLSVWLRTYIKADIYDTRNLKSVTNYLNSLPSTFYPIFSTFHGSQAAQNLVNILFNFIQAAMGAVEAMKYGDNELASSRIIKWYQIADQLSSDLARINVYWDENQWKNLLYQFIKLTVDEINAIVNDQYEEEIQIYDRIEDIVFLIASYMARGIISAQQAPME